VYVHKVSFLPDRRAFSVSCNTEAWCFVCFNNKKETVSDSSIEITRRNGLGGEEGGGGLGHR
jgi:hypothetical protein